MSTDHEPPGIDVPDGSEPTIDMRSLSYVMTYDHLTCPICKMPFINPYTTICGHTFCRSCIMEAIKSPMGSRCPLDRTPLKYNESLEGNHTHHSKPSDNQIFPAPIIITNIADDLKVKCMNKERGCNWVGSRWEIKIHILKYCPYTRFVCGKDDISGKACNKLCERRLLSSNTCPHIKYPCPKCEKLISTVELDWHLKHECDKNMMTCHGCNLEFPLKVFEDHEKYCEKIHVKCPGARFGCEWRGSRDMLKKVHRDECMFVKLSGYLESQEKKVNTLSHENTLLKSEFSSVLDSVIQGKITNLGFPLDVDEIEQSDASSDQILGSMEDDYAQLISDFEKLRLGAQKTKRTLAEISASKQMMVGLASDNVQIKEEITNQWLALTTLRRQMQMLLMDRRRDAKTKL